MTERELWWIATQAARSRVIVEVGIWKGRSTAAWCEHTRGVVFAVDHWSPEGLGSQAYREGLERGGSAIRDDALVNLSRYRESGRLFVLETDAATAAQHLGVILRHRKADLVFLDGNHQQGAVADDVRNYRPLIRPGGLLCGHDYPEVRSGLERCLESVEINPVDAGTIWWSRV